MNLGQLRNLALSWLDDLNGTYFTSAQMNVYLNNAQREVQKQLIQAGENYYVKLVSTSTVLYQDTYALPTDFFVLHKFEYLLTGVTPSQVRQLLSFVPLVQLDGVSMTTGTPGAYTIRKNCVVIRPIPDTVQTLYLHYSPVVNDMTVDTAVPDVPIQYHEYIAVLATLDGFLKDNRDPSTMMLKKDMYLAMMKQAAENRNVDSPREVVDTDEGGAGFLF